MRKWVEKRHYRIILIYYPPSFRANSNFQANTDRLPTLRVPHPQNTRSVDAHRPRISRPWTVRSRGVHAEPFYCLNVSKASELSEVVASVNVAPGSALGIKGACKIKFSIQVAILCLMVLKTTTKWRKQRSKHYHCMPVFVISTVAHHARSTNDDFLFTQIYGCCLFTQGY